MKKQASPSPKTCVLTGKLIAASVAGAYLAVHAVGNLINCGKMPLLSPDFIIYFKPLTYAIAWAILSAVLLLYGSISKRFVYGFAFLSALAYATITATAAGSDPLAYALCGLAALMVILCGGAWASEPSPKREREFTLSSTSAKITVGVVAGLVGGVALFLLLASYLTYTTEPAYSTGTYAQLMHSLRQALSFDTTVEFGETVSHMAAHVSPIFLLYFPFYAILPSPVTLMVLQVAAVFSAVIPLWLIARRHGLSGGLAALLCGLLCLYPVTWSGAVGSLHEYSLLLPLLLWLLWALETERKVLVWVFAALVLCTRETAAIHLLTVAIYWLIVNRPSTETDGISRRAARLRGWILLGVSVLYLAVALILLSTVGRGTLLSRFDNVTGVYGVFFDSFFREFFNNPALILFELLTAEKLYYVLLLLLPLGGLPLLSGKKAGLVFLFPLLFLNLLADFPYHFNPDFPYGFGVTAFAFYLSVLAIESYRAREADSRRLRRILAVAACSTLILVSYRFAGQSGLIAYTFQGRDEVVAMDTLCEWVPADASVSASGRLRPNLAGRDELYRLSHEVETDLVVLDLREAWIVPAEEKYDKKYYTDKGYKVLREYDGVWVVLGK